jgi:hypothetical protein
MRCMHGCMWVKACSTQNKQPQHHLYLYMLTCFQSSAQVPCCSVGTCRLARPQHARLGAHLRALFCRRGGMTLGVLVLLLLLCDHHSTTSVISVVCCTGSHDSSMRRWECTSEPFFVEEENTTTAPSLCCCCCVAIVRVSNHVSFAACCMCGCAFRLARPLYAPLGAHL